MPSGTYSISVMISNVYFTSVAFIVKGNPAYTVPPTGPAIGFTKPDGYDILKR
jgi:hypothetical protein